MADSNWGISLIIHLNTVISKACCYAQINVLFTTLGNVHAYL
jgi:hypothetical protein